MTPVRNARVLFKGHIEPQGYPDPNKTIAYNDPQTLDLENTPLNGGFLTKTLTLSVEPHVFGRMRRNSGAPYTVGSPIASYGVCVVLRTETDEVKVGDHLYGDLAHEEYSIRASLGDLLVLDNNTTYRSPDLMDEGQVAYTGWKEFAKPKNDDVVYVTTGGGPIGSCAEFVIQLAKADGLKVIGSAGSDEKVAFMKELGADVAFNYKTTDVRDILSKEGPIDIFWDHVGGETLEAALDHAKVGARFVECGMISGYFNGGASVRNLMQIVTKDITIRGFIFIRTFDKYREEFYAVVPEKISKGEIKYKEEVTHGLDKVGDVLLGVLKGENKAKAVIRVADD
ncbi:Zinc-type alcohol dehydrogenase-like protein PB24D3.08c [Leucoagaricus sp. SymC.cos]|nr:Zinc-type alcohol dehydrogenase-like protein PB24D3.08c [Leucoagaricus sp. SymC.cos]